jgi:antirestriction protein ArdC
MATRKTQPSAHGSPSAAKRDFRQYVTDQIVRMLENGVAPWQQPWNSSGLSLGMPMNPTTGRAYRGGNAMHLMATGLEREYNDPRWMTYKQAKDQGWQVRRGEKGTQIEFWEAKSSPEGTSLPEPDSVGGQKEKRDDKQETRFIHRVYTVFNAKQIDGIPPYQPKHRTPFERFSAAHSPT